jgi:uncharacterized cofD-like protein
MRRQPQTPIVRLFLNPPVAAHPAVLEAIAGADLFVICPGSLLTGTIGVLLHPGVREALTVSQAPCIYVCNLMTQPGQTDGYTARQHLAVLTAYLGRHVEAVVLNNGPLPDVIRAIYAQHGSYPVVQDLTVADVPLYCADLVARPDAATLRRMRDPRGLAWTLGCICCGMTQDAWQPRLWQLPHSLRRASGKGKSDGEGYTTLLCVRTLLFVDRHCTC